MLPFNGTNSGRRAINESHPCTRKCLAPCKNPGLIIVGRTRETSIPAIEVSADMNFNSTSCSADAFRTFGFGVLRQFFDPHPLAAEIDQVMHDGLVADVSRTGEIRFQYVPMMTAKTPVSLSLLDRVEAVAGVVLGGSVLPTRAKGVRYSVAHGFCRSARQRRLSRLPRTSWSGGRRPPGPAWFAPLRFPGRTSRSWSRWYGSPGPARTRRCHRTGRPDFAR
jgi:hypothetical protein